MHNQLPFTERAVSGFPLSVGTSHAFETLFPSTQNPYDKERKIPECPPLEQIQSCYINVDTLFRNLVGSLDKRTFTEGDIGRFLVTIEEEISTIEGLFHTNASYILPIFYHSDYSDLIKKIEKHPSKIVTLREPNTIGQKLYEDRRLKVLTELHRRTDKIKKYKAGIYPDRYESSLVLTHHPYDLINYNKFSDISLLESNTGMVKNRSLWYTKFHSHPRHSLNNIPFNEKTLLLFGDKTMITPVKLAARDAILAIADQRHWTSLTTMEKLTLDITLGSKDPFLIAMWKVL